MRELLTGTKINYNQGKTDSTDKHGIKQMSEAAWRVYKQDWMRNGANNPSNVKVKEVM